jgi:hypothetical protein
MGRKAEKIAKTLVNNKFQYFFVIIHSHIKNNVQFFFFILHVDLIICFGTDR